MYQNYQQLQNSFNPYQGNAMGQQFSRSYQPYAPPAPPRPSPAPIEVYQVSNADEAKAQIANPVAPYLRPSTNFWLTKYLNSYMGL